jgi:hypothetical protein
MTISNSSKIRKYLRASLLVVGLLGVGAVAFSESQDALVRRYPYDPACPWGRVSNGKGMIVRCVSEQEANALAKAAPAPGPLTTPASTTPGDPTAPAGATQAPSSATAPTTAASGTPASPGAPVEGAPTPPMTSSNEFEVTVGPIVADKGELGLGKLSAPKDRYKKCVVDNGGLKGESGEVQVRFLVRTQGIAEGVTVHKRMNVSAEAARCVADIVDRRRVSVPSEPMVGATVWVKFQKGGE